MREIRGNIKEIIEKRIVQINTHFSNGKTLVPQWQCLVDIDKAVLPKNGSGIYYFFFEPEREVEKLNEIWRGREKDDKIPTKINDYEQPHGLLYLGTAKDLKTRLRLHICKKSEVLDGVGETTWALKLGRCEDLKTFKFYVGWVHFKDLHDKDYYLCEILEAILRHDLNPVIGA